MHCTPPAGAAATSNLCLPGTPCPVPDMYATASAHAQTPARLVAPPPAAPQSTLCSRAPALRSEPRRPGQPAVPWHVDSHSPHPGSPFIGMLHLPQCPPSGTPNSSSTNPSHAGRPVQHASGTHTMSRCMIVQQSGSPEQTAGCRPWSAYLPGGPAACTHAMAHVHGMPVKWSNM
jgi:hypothetical protein